MLMNNKRELIKNHLLSFGKKIKPKQFMNYDVEETCWNGLKFFYYFLRCTTQTQFFQGIDVVDIIIAKTI